MAHGKGDRILKAVVTKQVLVKQEDTNKRTIV